MSTEPTTVANGLVNLARSVGIGHSPKGGGGGCAREEGEDGRGLESARPTATGLPTAVVHVMHDANMMLAAHSVPGLPR